VSQRGARREKQALPMIAAAADRKAHLGAASPTPMGLGLERQLSAPRLVPPRFRLPALESCFDTDKKQNQHQHVAVRAQRRRAPSATDCGSRPVERKAPAAGCPERSSLSPGQVIEEPLCGRLRRSASVGGSRNLRPCPQSDFACWSKAPREAALMLKSPERLRGEPEGGLDEEAVVEPSLSSVSTCTSEMSTPRCRGRATKAASPGGSPNVQPKIGAWRRGAEIGKGSYGAVYRAQDVETGHIFAVKQAALEQGDSENNSEKLTVELDIFKSLRHPNIVSYLGHEIVDGNLCIFLEYVEGGSIANILRTFGALSGRPLQKATRGTLKGLNYLHSRKPPVVHRDVKGANLLVDSKFNVKVADFGCSKQTAATKSFTAIGSIPWMAPEVILQQEGYGRKADIWSLGCTVLEMATAATPWGHGLFDNVMCAIRHIGLTDATPPIPEDLPGPCHDLVAACVRREPEKRPSAAVALEMAFVAAGAQEA